MAEAHGLNDKVANALIKQDVNHADNVMELYKLGIMSQFRDR